MISDDRGSNVVDVSSLLPTREVTLRRDLDLFRHGVDKSEGLSVYCNVTMCHIGLYPYIDWLSLVGDIS